MAHSAVLVLDPMAGAERLRETTRFRPAGSDEPENDPVTVEIPQDLFRRKLAHRLLQQAVDAIAEFDNAAQLDFQVAADAGYYTLAAVICAKIKRPDLVREFERLANDAVARGQSAKPMRVHQKKKKP